MMRPMSNSRVLSLMGDVSAEKVVLIDWGKGLKTRNRQGTYTQSDSLYTFQLTSLSLAT